MPMLQIDLSRIWQQLIYDPKEPLLFSSGLFIFLFTGFMYIYFLVYKHHRAKTIFVTLFSLYFYYKSSGTYFLLLILSAIVDFSLANAIFKAESERKRKLILILSLVLNIGMLAYFKYTNFNHLRSDSPILFTTEHLSAHRYFILYLSVAELYY